MFQLATIAGPDESAQRFVSRDFRLARLRPIPASFSSLRVSSQQGLDAAGDDPQLPVRKRPLQLQCLVRRSQVSISSGIVRITGIALGWMAPTSAFGSVVRNA
jgi:hypothetical protein